VELHVAEREGTGERPLLVVHGGPDWDHSYLVEPLIRLPERYGLLFPDLRGCGRSSRGLADEQYSWDLAVEDLVALIDELGLPRVDVLGFSTGGMLALRLALRAPRRMRRLIIASSSVEPVPPDAFAGWAERDRRRAAAAEADGRLDGLELTRAWAFGSAAENVWRAEALPDYLSRLERINFSGDWARQWRAGRLGDARPADSRRRLDETGIPVLLLHGRQDMTFPSALAEAAAAAMRTATVRILDDAGHMAHIDQPDRWLAAVLEFLR
jgi:pimeloyl-ACP methyl ester carboxylesterase